MKFLIQTIGGEVRHDFAFQLLEAIRFRNWWNKGKKGEGKIIVKYLDYIDDIPEPDDIYPMPFKPYHKSYIPIGSVEFVSDFLMHFYNVMPKPINVPPELALRGFTLRPLFNGDEKVAENLNGKWFVKSMDKIKGFAEMFHFDVNHYWSALPKGNYQYSEYRKIDSEWRVFVYDKKLVGLQNYSGEFTVFPNVDKIKLMIDAYKSAPIAYTLDVGVEAQFDLTFVIEVHDFFSCGLYGFRDAILLRMFKNWYYEYLKKLGLNISIHA